MKIRFVKGKEKLFGKAKVNRVIEYFPTYNIKKEGKIFGLGWIILDFTKEIKINIACEHEPKISFIHVRQLDGETAPEPNFKYCSKCKKLLEEY